MHSLNFFKAFIKNWKQVGWPLQTSHAVAKGICDEIDFRRAETIVEIGSGTGNVTKEILKSLKPDGQLVVFEINRDLCSYLRAIPDPRLVVYNISGLEIARLLPRKADYVVSEIPVATLSEAAFYRFFEGIKAVLRESGSCIQVQLSLLSYRRLKRCFDSVAVRLVVLNPPPLFIYRCSGQTMASGYASAPTKNRAA